MGDEKKEVKSTFDEWMDSLDEESLELKKQNAHIEGQAVTYD